MTQPPLTLSLLPATFAVCRLSPDARVPPWAEGGSFTSITRTAEELSIVCEETCVPRDAAPVERGWRCFRLHGPIPFETTGVAAALVRPLAVAGISVFLLATFDTDYVMVKNEKKDETVAAWRASGFEVRAG